MSELDKLRELRSYVPGPTPESLRMSRARMLSNLRPPARLPGLAWKAALAGGLAVALFAGPTVIQGLGSSLPGGMGPGATAEAAEVLELAAATVEDDAPLQRPRDDQYIFVKELARDSMTNGKVVTRKDWTRFSYDKGVDRDNRSPRDIWEFNESLPNDPEAALETIYAEVRRIYANEPDWDKNWVKGDWLHDRAFWLCSVLLGDADGLPAQPETQATLYRAIARIPGVEVRTDVEDLAGRKGVMIYYESGPAGALEARGIILSSTTYEYLGHKYWSDLGPDFERAVLERKVVDKPGKPKPRVVDRDTVEHR